MNNAQRAAFEQQVARICGQLNEAFVEHLTSQLVQMKRDGVDKATRRAVEQAAIAWYYERESQVANMLERNLLTNKHDESSELRVRAELLDEIKELMS
jgi:hypothetical protein